MPARETAYGTTWRSECASGAPYGYRYVKKSDTSAAFYEIIEAEAKIVRMIYELYTQQGSALTRSHVLNEREIPTRTGKSRWERFYGWGHTAQSGLSWNGLLRQDGTGFAAKDHASASSAKRISQPR
jgi:hypothetical protein